MIKIINGVFGYNDGKGIVPITKKDGPISCPKEIEERLIAQGVAVCVEEKVNTNENQENAESKGEEVNANREELIAEYKALGLRGNPAGMKDKTLINKIKEAKSADTSNTGDQKVDDFLNGKTDEVPPRTEEISEDEAKKLQENAVDNEPPVEDGEDAPDLGQDDGVVG